MIYDPEANILSWEVGKGKITHTNDFGNLIIHMGAGGTPLLIEMLDASKLTGQFDKIKELRDIKKIIPATQI